MKKNIKSAASNLYGYSLLFAILLTINSCSKKYVFESSAIVPAAEGTIKVKKDKNENYGIKLAVRNLAPAENLVETRSTYVLWANTSGNGTKNLGQLKNSTGLFSKALRSELVTATPFEPRSFFITAENKADINYPDGQVILKTK
ncbi:hypothetical protein SAMN04487995_0480 [Dyadobacter koreensis]|uniref:Uncharacterized protein n=1 Tax=Dyadobacter koreensis TaxID=408657 RepID=A0A1H6QB63_9BACT|nr:hypothetical protein [Dyadobacter koreensis]SEI41008.1 hypothetical protein SAMN04487995_0480 [Dyadobacter koreensis]